MVFRRKPVMVAAWKVPLTGRTADEDLPTWLVERLSNRAVVVNHLGGLSTATAWGSQGCAPGDYILLNERDGIEFCAVGDFESQFEVVTEAA